MPIKRDGVKVPTQSAHAHLSRDLLLWVRAEAEGVWKLFEFGLDIVNPLQAASVWTLADKRGSYDILSLLQINPQSHLRVGPE